MTPYVSICLSAANFFSFKRFSPHEMSGSFASVWRRSRQKKNENASRHFEFGDGGVGFHFVHIDNQPGKEDALHIFNAMLVTIICQIVHNWAQCKCLSACWPILVENTPRFGLWGVKYLFEPYIISVHGLVLNYKPASNAHMLNRLN